MSARRRDKANDLYIPKPQHAEGFSIYQVHGVFASQPKRLANIAKYGLDPADFEAAFSFDRYLAISTKPSCTGRERIKLIGSWHDVTVVVAIVSPLGSKAIDVVSVRPANAKDRARSDEA